MASVTLLTGGNVPKGLESPTKERKEIRIIDIARKENSMTDKEKIRAEVMRLRTIIQKEVFNSYSPEDADIGKIDAYTEILSFIDSMQEEPKKCMYSKDHYTDEDKKILCEGCEEECEFKPTTSVWHDARKKPKMNSIIVMNNDQTTLSVEYVGQSLCGVERWAYLDILLKL